MCDKSRAHAACSMQSARHSMRSARQLQHERCADWALLGTAASRSAAWPSAVMPEHALHRMTSHTKHDAHLACEVGILLEDVLALCLQALDLVLLALHGLIQLGDGLHSCLHLSGFRCTSTRMASEPCQLHSSQVTGKTQAMMFTPSDWRHSLLPAPLGLTLHQRTHGFRTA
jgi:hypothetical protein